MFINRQDAGRQLATTLLSGHYPVDIVVGLAWGGVAVSREISHILGIPRDVLVVKKIGSPGNPELATGATVPSGQNIAVKAKRVIIADDGIATGETMKAAIEWMKRNGASHILVAVPVAPPDATRRLKELADDVIVCSVEADFASVGQFYKHFPQGGL
jgi:predicted phosphoribosyltransferase